MIFNWFKQDKKPVISQDLERRRIRNEARFEALKKQMESEGKHRGGYCEHHAGNPA